MLVDATPTLVAEADELLAPEPPRRARGRAAGTGRARPPVTAAAPVARAARTAAPASTPRPAPPLDRVHCGDGRQRHRRAPHARAAPARRRSAGSRSPPRPPTTSPTTSRAGSGSSATRCATPFATRSRAGAPRRSGSARSRPDASDRAMRAARARAARGGRRSRAAGRAARAPGAPAREARRVAAGIALSRCGAARPQCDVMETAKPQRRIGRLSEIGRVATRHGFGYLIDRRRSNDNTQLADRGRRLREMLDELGPTFVKFGQLLSTRPDVMPPDIIVELRSLQDDVTPIAFADVRRVIEEELGLTLEQAFLTLRRDADRRGLDRPGAPRDAADRRRGRGQGAAAGGAAPDRVRPAADALGREGRPRARARPRLHRRGGARRRVRALDPPGARLPARGPQRRDVPAQLRRLDRGRRAEGDLALLVGARADARVPRGDAVRRPRSRRRARPRSAASSPTG